MSDELYDKSESSKKKDSKKGSKNKIQINPIYIHIGLILLIILLLFYFFSDFSFNFSNNDEKIQIITLVGNLKQFNKTYSGDLDIYSKQFILQTTNAKYNENSKDIKIKGFNGTIALSDNMSLILKGVAEKIEYGKNNIEIKGTKFEFESFKKTSINLLFKELNLNFEDGRIKVGEDLNYEFENSSINLNNYNATLSYDGMFSFSGPLETFNLKNLNNNIQISYQAPKKIESKK